MVLVRHSASISKFEWFEQLWFSRESWDKLNEIMKPQKIYWPWGLGPRKYIRATWAQKTYPTISLEAWLQFSQTGPRFLKSHETNSTKLWNLKKIIDLGAWSLETTFGPLAPWRCIQPYVQKPGSNFHKQDLIFSKIVRWIQYNHET